MFTKMLTIAQQLEKIHEKLDILRHVQVELNKLEDSHHYKLGGLRRTEEKLLGKLSRMKYAKSQAERVGSAERSHHHWAFAKLDYTLNMTQEQSQFLQKRLTNEFLSIPYQYIHIYVYICTYVYIINADEAKELQTELKNNERFSKDLRTFFEALKRLSDVQQLMIKDLETAVDNTEADLVQVRYEMSKIRHATFAKLYELHKNIEIADTLDLGQRRVSVANATEIERERRHHATKIQRQLSSLQSQLREIDVGPYTTRLEEMVDCEVIMSDSKLKAFFCVFVQCFCQTLIDVHLLNVYMDDNNNNNNNNNQTPDTRNVDPLAHFYGIHNVLDAIPSNTSSSSSSSSSTSLSLDNKRKKIGQFIRVLQAAIAREKQATLLRRGSTADDEEQSQSQSQSQLQLQPQSQLRSNNNRTPPNDLKVKMEDLVPIALLVGRKLTCDSNVRLHIDETDNLLVPKLAETRCLNIFTAVVYGVDIFPTVPLSVVEVCKKNASYISFMCIYVYVIFAIFY
ncbi:hypothetical protein RFI_04867 [Reticulomyxa filosa]|uniref:Uncharacterized protein n=1 Tax=Reticulomyxa filosa TaxID=46433 RepID=X6P101_RETFI|nr:hypothetical protein RFI_04867 [Reticulomyxa filosa]|eukprot:ETO32250.1 hypothetical protein RFI_04867 [Reticulomyxa filosa]